MKPGDLVRLKAGWLHAGGVAVSWTPPGRYAARSTITVTRFDTGTPALLLQTDEVKFRGDAGRRVSFILIGGRMGRLWAVELEPL